MQSKTELDEFYREMDPWGFKGNPYDAKRKDTILNSLPKKFYKRALDIGCGEGWITKDIPAAEIHGIELSSRAASRCPKNVTVLDWPVGKYDLVLACGVLYKQYDYKTFLKMIKDHAIKTVVTCNIASWEMMEVMEIGKQVEVRDFPYRNYTQRLRVFEVTP